jgi:prolipoprotein diacylglyceryl transferase
LPAEFPSPPFSSFDLGPLHIQMYAICILVGIVLAVLITNARLTRRGGEPWVTIDFALWAVPLGIIVARLWHVITHLDDYFGEGKNTWNPLEHGAVWNVWDGGIAIFGALVGGALGIYIASRISGIRFLSFADALVPGLLVAQAFGRLGNWFNQELFGVPTDVPWGLLIASDNPAYPVGLPEGTLFHPMFLYELLWNLLGVAVILGLEHWKKLRWGKVLALYLIWYGLGRFVFEAFRLDPSEVILGLRVNAWAAVAAFILGVVLYIVQSRRHPGVEESVYKPGRSRPGQPTEVDSTDGELFVDHGEGAAIARS